MTHFPRPGFHVLNVSQGMLQLGSLVTAPPQHCHKDSLCERQLGSPVVQREQSLVSQHRLVLLRQHTSSTDHMCCED